MTSIHSYKDTSGQCWANIRMPNGEPVWISVANTGVIVKNSRLGILGKKLFEGGRKDPKHFATVMINLQKKFPNNLIPAECDITSTVLKTFVNVCLHCSSLSEIEEVFDTNSI